MVQIRRELLRDLGSANVFGDNDARELARRCFRLSEIFLEEEEKRG